jgi:hypothetical protein
MHGQTVYQSITIGPHRKFEDCIHWAPLLPPDAVAPTPGHPEVTPLSDEEIVNRLTDRNWYRYSPESRDEARGAARNRIAALTERLHTVERERDAAHNVNFLRMRELHALTQQRDRYAAVVEAAKELMGEYSQQSLHVRRDPKPGASPSVCNWCGFSWPCPTSTLRDALAALEENDDL